MIFALAEAVSDDRKIRELSTQLWGAILIEPVEPMWHLRRGAMSHRPSPPDNVLQMKSLSGKLKKSGDG